MKITIKNRIEYIYIYAPLLSIKKLLKYLKVAEPLRATTFPGVSSTQLINLERING